MTFVAVMAEADLWEGEMRGVDLDGTPVLIVRLDGVVRAYADRCPHLGVRLSEGELFAGNLTCSAHRWCFEMTSGRGVNPASISLRSLPSRLLDGKVWVSLEEVA